MAITPRDYVIGIIIFTLVVGCSVSIMSIFKADDPTLGSDSPEFASFNSTFNKYNDVNTLTAKWQNDMENVSQDNSALGVWDSLISGGWSLISLLGQSLSFMKGIFDSFGSIFGLGDYPFIAALIYMIIIVTIIFAVYSAVFRRDL
jgi:hypothetical protein